MSKHVNVVDAHIMRVISVTNILQKEGVTESEFVSYVMDKITDAADEGHLFTELSIEEDNKFSELLFTNYKHYMILTRKFRTAGYTVTPSYTHENGRQTMTRITFSWGNAVDKL